MVEDIIWKTVERPGFFGKKKFEKIKQYNDQYGEGNWKLAWKWNGNIIDTAMAYQVYENGYYTDSFMRTEVWKELLKVAKDVYDHHESDIESGLDYFVQKGTENHLQDISLRRVALLRGWKFEGNELIQIRKHKTKWGYLFSPGKVPFHLPKLIVEPALEGWWDPGTIEDFYQSNKILLVKEKPRSG